MIRKIFLLCIGIIVFISGYIFVYNFLHSVEVTIKTKNVSSYRVKSDKKILYTSDTGESHTIRVPEKSNFTVIYTSVKPYESGKVAATTSTKPETINLQPYYSKEYLAELANPQKNTISTVINSFSRSIPEFYNVDKISLYHYGEWASAELVWAGKYSQNSDTQKIILKKSNNNWMVVGGPDILLFYKNNPDIPVDIVENTNN